MASVMFNHIFSFFNGLIVILFCPPDLGVAIPLVSDSTLTPDTCVDLPMTCVGEIDEYQTNPSCKQMETTLRCLDKVVDLCSEGISGEDLYHDDDNNDDYAQDSSYSQQGIDFTFIAREFNESISDYKQACSSQDYSSISTLRSNSGFLCAVCMMFTFYL